MTGFGWEVRQTGLALAALLAASTASAQRFGPRQVDSLPSSVPTLVEQYGSDSLQFGELRLPLGRGPFPVAVVIHGGCWTKGFATRRNTAPLATAVMRLGVATWNIEYRQVGDPGAGWPGTFQDVGAGIDYLRTLATRYSLDLSHVVLMGHSAGAHLALWGAGRPRLPTQSVVRGQNPLRVSAAMAIDGPGDIASFIGRDAQICGKPVIAPLMGGLPAEQAERYREGSPSEMLPIGVKQYLVAAQVLTGTDALRYQSRARAAGDSVAWLISSGNHFDVIGPGRAPFEAVLTFIGDAFGMHK